MHKYLHPSIEATLGRLLFFMPLRILIVDDTKQIVV